MRLGLGLGIGSRSKGGGFSLAAFMAGQSDGFDYNFGQTDRLFQENVGLTPADDPNEVIGLALSSRLWNGRTLAQEVAAGTELVVNGSFSADTNWTKTQATISGGVATINSPDGSFAGVRQDIPGASGRLYEISFDLLSLTGTAPSVDFGATATAQVSAALGRKTVRLVASGASNTFFIKRTSGVTLFTVTNVSVKEVSRYPATQTGTQRPTFQTTGAKFDAIDDNLLTGYTAGAEANFMAIKTAVPESLSAIQVIAGAAAGSSGRFWLGIDNATGYLRYGLGNTSALAGSTDLRGQTAVIGLSNNGTLVRAFEGSSLLLETAQSGSPTTVHPVRLGSNNSNGTASNFFGGSIARIVAGRELIDLATFNQIANAL